MSANITPELMVLAALVAFKSYFLDRGTMIRFVNDYRQLMHSIPDFDSLIQFTNLITIDEEQDQSLRDSELQRQVL